MSPSSNSACQAALFSYSSNIQVNMCAEPLTSSIQHSEWSLKILLSYYFLVGFYFIHADHIHNDFILYKLYTRPPDQKKTVYIHIQILYIYIDNKESIANTCMCMCIC